MGGVALPSNDSEADPTKVAEYIHDQWKHGIPRFVNYGRQGRLTLRSVKLFADGEHSQSSQSNNILKCVKQARWGHGVQRYLLHTPIILPFKASCCNPLKSYERLCEDTGQMTCKL